MKCPDCDVLMEFVDDLNMYVCNECGLEVPE